MSAQGQPSLTFGFSFSFSLWIGGSKEKPDKAVSQPKTKQLASINANGDVDTKEEHLSPTAKDLQHQIRERARERSAEAESLRLLEDGTAALAKRASLAKARDRESLALLEYYTMRDEGLLNPSQSLMSPSFLPTLPQIKGLNGTPLSYDPSFSTPKTIDNSIQTPSSENAFEEFLIRDIGKDVRARRLTVNPLMYFPVSAPSKNFFSRSVFGKADRRRANSVLGLFNSIDQQDAQTEHDVGEDMSEALDMVMASPTSSIKHLPADYWRTLKKGKHRSGSPNAITEGGGNSSSANHQGAASQNGSDQSRDGDEPEFENESEQEIDEGDDQDQCQGNSNRGGDGYYTDSGSDEEVLPTVKRFDKEDQDGDVDWEIV